MVVTLGPVGVGYRYTIYRILSSLFTNISFYLPNSVQCDPMKSILVILYRLLCRVYKQCEPFIGKVRAWWVIAT